MKLDAWEAPQLMHTKWFKNVQELWTWNSDSSDVHAKVNHLK